MAITRSIMLSGLIWLPASVASAHEYTVEGSLAHTQYFPTRPPDFVQERFTVRVSGAQWLIREELDLGGKPFESQTSFDGTNRYRFVIFPPAKGLQNDARQRGFINSGEMPPPEWTLNTSVIWLAYASGPDFLQAEPGKARPVWPLEPQGLWATGFKVSASWNLRPAPPFLPEQVTYYDDGMTHPLDGSQPVYFSPAFTNVFYSAAFTNLNELALPIKFSMLRARMANGISGSWVSATDEAVATKIIPSCGLRSFRPDFTGSAYISDCRVEPDSALAVRYKGTNGNWRVMSYANLVVQQTQTRLQAEPTRTPRGRSKSWVTLLGMTFVSAGFVALMFKAAREQQAEQPIS